MQNEVLSDGLELKALSCTPLIRAPAQALPGVAPDQKTERKPKQYLALERVRDICSTSEFQVPWTFGYNVCGPCAGSPRAEAGEARGHYVPPPPQGAPGSSSHPPGWPYSSPFHPRWLCHPHSSSPAGPSRITPLSGSSSPSSPLSQLVLPPSPLHPASSSPPPLHSQALSHSSLHPAPLSQRVLPPFTLPSQLALSPSSPLSWPAFPSFQPRFLG